MQRGDQFTKKINEASNFALKYFDQITLFAHKLARAQYYFHNTLKDLRC